MIAKYSIVLMWPLLIQKKGWFCDKLLRAFETGAYWCNYCMGINGKSCVYWTDLSLNPINYKLHCSHLYLWSFQVFASLENTVLNFNVALYWTIWFQDKRFTATQRLVILSFILNLLKTSVLTWHFVIRFQVGQTDNNDQGWGKETLRKLAVQWFTPSFR